MFWHLQQWFHVFPLNVMELRMGRYPQSAAGGRVVLSSKSLIVSLNGSQRLRAVCLSSPGSLGGG